MIPSALMTCTIICITSFFPSARRLHDGRGWACHFIATSPVPSSIAGLSRHSRNVLNE